MSRSEKENADLERQVKKRSSSGELYLLPPGFWVFVLVNMLLILAVGMLVLLSQSVFFAGEREKAAVFSVISGGGLAIVIVTPAFFVMRGFRKALHYMKILPVIILLLIVFAASVDAVNRGQLSLFAVVGFIAGIAATSLIRGKSYRLLSLFTAARRGLAVNDAERKSSFISR